MEDLKNVENFCLSVAAKAMADEMGKGTNIIVSPMSVAVALNLLALGFDGETVDELLGFLGGQDQLKSHSDSMAALLKAAPEQDGSSLSSSASEKSEYSWIKEVIHDVTQSAQVKEQDMNAEKPSSSEPGGVTTRYRPPFQLPSSPPRAGGRSWSSSRSSWPRSYASSSPPAGRSRWSSQPRSSPPPPCGASRTRWSRRGSYSPAPTDSWSGRSSSRPPMAASSSTPAPSDSWSWRSSSRPPLRQDASSSNPAPSDSWSWRSCSRPPMAQGGSSSTSYLGMVNHDASLASPPMAGAQASASGQIRVDLEHGSSGKEGRETIFTMANVVAVECQSLRFADISASPYNVLVKNVDFENEVQKVKDEINSWAKEETNGRVNMILSTTDELSKPLFVANAVYFKGIWGTPFRDIYTHQGDFFLENGRLISVPFLTSYFRSYKFALERDFKVLELPYWHDSKAQERFSMFIFLPHSKDGLKDLVARFNTDPGSLNPNKFQLKIEVFEKICIPKMKLTYNFNAKEGLNSKGLVIPFQPSFIQKVFLRLNGRGKAMAIDQPISTEPALSFMADRPFMFFIKSTSKTLLVGAVVNPLLE